MNQLLQLLMAFFGPDFMKLLNEVMDEYKRQKSEQTSLDVDSAFKQAKEQKNTEPLATEIGRLIK